MREVCIKLIPPILPTVVVEAQLEFGEFVVVEVVIFEALEVFVKFRMATTLGNIERAFWLLIKA